MSNGMTKRKKIIAVIAAIVVGSAATMVAWIGPRNVIGMLRYDQREEGRLKVGDEAPDVELRALVDGKKENIKAFIGQKPLILIFGSFT